MIVATLTEADIAMLETASRRGVIYIPAEEEDVD